MKLAELYTELTVRDKGFSAGLFKAQLSAQAVTKVLTVVVATVKRVAREMYELTKASVINASAQETAEQKLRTALDATGQAATKNLPVLMATASEIQNMTTVGDEAAMELMTLGLNMGATADDVDEITKAAIGLSRALNMDVATAMRYAILATQGETTMLARYVPAIRTAKNETEKMAAINATAARGWASAKEETLTFAGQVAQLKNELGDVSEVLGTPLMHALTKVIMKFREFGVTGDNVKLLMDNWRIAWGIIARESELALIRLYENTKFVIVEQMPKYIKWFSDLWGKAWEYIANAGFSAMEYLTKSVAAFGKYVGQVLKIALQGLKVVVDRMKPIVEFGYETFQEDLGKRELTERERDLVAEIGVLRHRLNQKRKEIGAAKDEFGLKLKPGMGEAATKVAFTGMEDFAKQIQAGITASKQEKAIEEIKVEAKEQTKVQKEMSKKLDIVVYPVLTK